jgi:LacI family sucrose operon transcriptional repressor
MLLANQVDGIIVGSRNTPSELYKKTRLAIVSIDRMISDEVPNVRSDNYEGAKLAAEYLMAKNCKHVGLFIGSPPGEIERGDLRMRGFLDTINGDMGMSVCAVGFDESEDYQREMIEKYLTERPGIDGIFATGDILAGMIRGISGRMGKKIEIVGYDGTKAFINLCPEICTIVQPIEDMASVAVETLMSMISEEYDEVQKEYVLPIKFVGKR